MKSEEQIQSRSRSIVKEQQLPCFQGYGSSTVQHKGESGKMRPNFVSLATGQAEKNHEPENGA
jgi:hypothetical protein